MILGESQQHFASPEEALVHYGVKGMRKGRGTPNRIDRKNGRDPKRLAILYGRRRGKKESLAVQSKMADHVNEKVGAVNDKYSGEDFSNVDWGDPSSWTPRAKEYRAGVLSLTAEADRVAVKDAYGVTPTDKRRAELNDTGDQIVLREVKVQHAANDDDTVAIFQVTRDSSGLIIKIEPLEQEADALKQIAAGNEFLQHHGIKGMKWGVRNKRETGSGDGKVGDPVSAAIGAFYIGLMLAAVAVSIRDIRRRSTDSGKKYQKQNANVAWKKKPELAQKAPPMDVNKLHDQVVKQVNPNYPKPGTKMNCRRATFAYEMRRRGYDVQATPSHFATGQDARGLQIATMSPAIKHESRWGQKEVAPERRFSRETPQRRSELIFESLNKYPDGARGELGVGWQFGGGHSMAFEKVNGKAVVFDTQTAKIYRDPASFSEFASVTHAAAHTRTDNIKLDEQYLRRWVVNN